MTLLTFPWDDIGTCTGVDPYDISNVIEDGYTGYIATRAETTRMTKGFNIYHNFMTSAQWLALIEFYRSVYGSADAFYWEFPTGFWGVAGYGGENLGIDSPGGWDTEGEGMGFGTGPVFIVRFKDKILHQKHIKAFYWNVSYVLEEV